MPTQHTRKAAGLLKLPASFHGGLLLTSPRRNRYLPNKLFVLFQSPSGPIPSCPAAAAGSVPARCLAWEDIARWPTRVVLPNWLAGYAVREDLAFFFFKIVCFIKVCLLKQISGHNGNVFFEAFVLPREPGRALIRLLLPQGSEVHVQLCRPRGQHPGISSLPSSS